MKKLLLTTLCLAIFGSGFTQNRVIRIEGNITSVPDTINLIFMHGDGRSYSSFESDTVVKGRFTVEYTPDKEVELPTWFSVIIFYGQTSRSQNFMAGAGVTSITGNGMDV